MEKVGLLEMLRVIREQEPSKPSTKLSRAEGLPTLAANRGTEPAKLTRLLRGELDWIVMKALEKDRNRRYETANGFAMDLQRYLSDEAVHACPPSAGYRFRKFARRNKRALTSAAVLALAALVVAGTLGWAVRDREARQEEAAKQEGARQAKLQEEVTRDLGEAKALYKGDRWPEALAPVKRAEGLLAAGPPSAELQRSVDQSRADLEMVAGLEDIRVERASEPRGEFNAADQAFGVAFRQYGLEVESLDPDEAARRIGESVIKHHLIAALDDWLLAKRALSTRRTHSPARQKELAAAARRLLKVARRADSDPFRDRLREALQRGDTKPLSTLAFEENARTQPLVSVLLLDSIVSETMGYHPGSWAAHKVLRQARQLHPDDFWINHRLASQLTSVRLDSDLIFLHAGGAAEAVGYCRAALALRPNSYSVRINLGLALTWAPRPRADRERQLPEAEAEYRAAIRLQLHFASLCPRNRARMKGRCAGGQGQAGRRVPAPRRR